jgi:hypothetical protein
MSINDTIPLRAYYAPDTDLFIVEFLDPAIFFPLSGDSAGAWKWSMFTHGVCADVHSGTFWFNGIAITGRHLWPQPPNHENLEDRLKQAEKRMAHHSTDRPPDWPVSINEQRSHEAARLLSTYRERIIADLLSAWKESQGHSNV